jgi:3'-phosphoadenosine 5'-phosphosulfate sulfotransferase (PAPS reductase)/FAD synthetase
MPDGRATSNHAAIDQAVVEHQPSHVFALFSGGHDSLCSTHVAAQHPSFSGVCHVNTGIGIEETREFVRQTCREHGWPLLEYHPDGKTYEDLVREKGMPGGPQSHNTMYYWLKQRQIRRLVADHKQHRNDRVMLVTGIRRKESGRRMESTISVPVRRNGAQLWVNPILDWTKADCNAYIAEHGLRRNEVSDTLHRSGECLCGALASHDEIGDIERWYPAAALEIHRIEQVAVDAGQRSIKWAYRPPEVHRDQLDFLPLCASCQGGYA